MYVTAQESRALSHLFGLLAEDLAEREVRERIGHHLLEVLSADYYASFVWDTPSRSFGSGVCLNMSLLISPATTPTINTTTRSPSSFRRAASRRW
jgi:hypothetical protein